MLGTGYMEYELPHPQVDLALGLFTVKPRLFRSSWKSTTAPARYSIDRLSTTTSMPWNSSLWSVFSSYLGSRSSLFWNPLHPPPCTRTRRYSLVPGSTCPLACMSATCRFTSDAAFSVTLSGGAAGGASLTPRFWVSGATAVDMGFPFDGWVRVGST